MGDGRSGTGDTTERKPGDAQRGWADPKLRTCAKPGKRSTLTLGCRRNQRGRTNSKASVGRTSEKPQADRRRDEAK